MVIVKDKKMKFDNTYQRMWHVWIFINIPIIAISINTEVIKKLRHDHTLHQLSLKPLSLTTVDIDDIIKNLV